MNKHLYLYNFLFIILLVLSLYLFDHFNDTSVQNQKVDTSSNLLEIYYFDVGEADSTLIRYKEHNILIDGGNTVDGVKIVPYLKEIGVKKFDYLIATHAHEDHIGGLSRVIYQFPVDYFFMPDHSAEWKSYDNLMSALDSKNVLLETPLIDYQFSIDDLLFTILWVGKDREDYNENSIVLKLNYFNTSYLFMGDATEDVERQILDKDLKSDVLKVGHHGSKYSSSANFLNQVKPTYAIISCGVDNRYYHPHKVVLDKLEYLNSTIYRTDINHTIHLVSDGDSIQFDFIETDLNGGDLG